MPILHYLKRSRFGYSKKDKLILFTSISISIATYLTLRVFIRLVYGKKKRNQIFMKRGYRLLGWIANRSVMIIRDDVLLSIYPRSEIGCLDDASSESQIQDYLSKHNFSDGAIVDLGANLGLYTIMLAKSYPNSKVVAVEASPTIFNRLKANCERNKVSNVVLVNKAISNEDNRRVEFYLDINGLGTSTMLREYKINDIKDRYDLETTETVTIDTLVRAMNLDKISFMKIDIEGAERLALEGACDSLRSGRLKNIIIEYHSLSNCEFISSLLKSLGYEYVTYSVQSHYGENIPRDFQGHIIARLIDASLWR